jgi:hypothetical protein
MRESTPRIHGRLCALSFSIGIAAVLAWHGAYGAAASMRYEGKHVVDGCRGSVQIPPGSQMRIGFRVSCNDSDDRVVFSLARLTVGSTPGNKLWVHHFSHGLRSIGPGAEGRGQCKRRGPAIYCRGRRRGPVTFAGWIEVVPGTQCKAVALTKVVEPREDAWPERTVVGPSPIEHRILFKGKATGCPIP